MCRISGNVTGGPHREFAMASGEMTAAQFLTFNLAWIKAALDRLADGGLFGAFIDWRGLPTVHAAATQLGLAPLNLIVWAKSNAGMGSLYRSQHELLPLFKKGDGAHLNNIELGRKGRWRSNSGFIPAPLRWGRMRARGSRTTRPSSRRPCWPTRCSTSPRAANRHRSVPWLRLDADRRRADGPALPRRRDRSALCRRDHSPL